MEKDRIDKSLERFYSGETSLEEERELKGYFNSEESSKESNFEAEYFRTQANSRIDRFEGELSFPEKTTRSLYDYVKYGIAAAVVIGGISLAMVQFQDFQEEQRIQESYLQTKQALTFISLKMNKGKEKIQKLSEFERIQKKVERHEQD